MTDARASLLDRRRSVLVAALGFLQLHHQPPEITPLRRYLDSWRGVGDIVTGLNAQGFDLELRQFPQGWRANLYPTGTAHSIRCGVSMGADGMAGSAAGQAG